MKLLVIMPLFNEEESIIITHKEWIEELNLYPKLDYKILLINDGSTDNSQQLIENLSQESKETLILSKKNEGHGKACWFGYNYAEENGFTHVMQLDSDGQCDPKYFAKFYNVIASDAQAIIYGLRYYRKDGWVRFFVSRVLSIVAFMRMRIWMFDPNVPYRLFPISSIREILPFVREEPLINVFLALYHRKKYKINFVSIVFRDRWGGSPTVNAIKLWPWFTKFLNSIKNLKPYIING